MGEAKLYISGLYEYVDPYVSHEKVYDLFNFYYVGDWVVWLSFVPKPLEDVAPSTIADASKLIDGEGRIRVYVENLTKAYDEGIVIGGNITVAPSMTCAILQALRHEVQHLNQYYLSGDALSPQHVAFNKAKRYRGRPCEIDARASVDRSFDELIALAEQ